MPIFRPINPIMFVVTFGMEAQVASPARAALRRSVSVSTPSGLDLDVHARRDVQLLERFHRLSGRARDVDEPLVDADLELLARLLVDVRAPEHGVDRLA